MCVSECIGTRSEDCIGLWGSYRLERERERERFCILKHFQFFHRVHIYIFSDSLSARTYIFNQISYGTNYVNAILRNFVLSQQGERERERAIFFVFKHFRLFYIQFISYSVVHCVRVHIYIYSIRFHTERITLTPFTYIFSDSVSRERERERERWDVLICFAILYYEDFIHEEELA